MAFPTKSFPTEKPVDFLSKSPAPAPAQDGGADLVSIVSDLIGQYGADAVKQAVESAAGTEATPTDMATDVIEGEQE